MKTTAIIDGEEYQVHPSLCFFCPFFVKYSPKRFGCTAPGNGCVYPDERKMEPKTKEQP